MALLSFKDLYYAEYRPGEDELINYRAYRRKRLPENTEQSEVDEALTVSQRYKKKRDAHRYKAKRELGRKRAKRKMAPISVLKKRTNRQAREKLFKILTKGIPKSELTFAKRQEIEKKLDKPAMKLRQQRIAKREFPKVRRKEQQRKKR